MRNPFKKENTWNEEEDTTAQHTHRKKNSHKDVGWFKGKIMNAGESGTTTCWSTKDSTQGHLCSGQALSNRDVYCHAGWRQGIPGVKGDTGALGG